MPSTTGKNTPATIESGAYHASQVTTDYGRVVTGLAARVKTLQEDISEIAAIEGWDTGGQDNEDYRYFCQYMKNIHSMLVGAAIVDTRRIEMGKKGKV